MMAMNDDRVRTLRRLSIDRKFGLTSAPRRNKRGERQEGRNGRLVEVRQLAAKGTACVGDLLIVSVMRSPARVKLCFVDLDACGVDDDFFFGHCLARHLADDARRAHDEDAVAYADEFLHSRRR